MASSSTMNDSLTQGYFYATSPTLMASTRHGPIGYFFQMTHKMYHVPSSSYMLSSDSLRLTLLSLYGSIPVIFPMLMSSSTLKPSRCLQLSFTTSSIHSSIQHSHSHNKFVISAHVPTFFLSSIASIALLFCQIHSTTTCKQL